MALLKTSLPEGRSKKVIDAPLILEPETPVEGLVAFSCTGSHGFKFNDDDKSFEYAPDGKSRLVLTVSDSISGKSEDFPVEDSWSA